MNGKRTEKKNQTPNTETGELFRYCARCVSLLSRVEAALCCARSFFHCHRSKVVQEKAVSKSLKRWDSGADPHEVARQKPLNIVGIILAFDKEKEPAASNLRSHPPESRVRCFHRRKSVYSGHTSSSQRCVLAFHSYARTPEICKHTNNKNRSTLKTEHSFHGEADR